VAALVGAGFLGLRAPAPRLSPATDTTAAPRLKLDPDLDLKRLSPGAR